MKVVEETALGGSTNFAGPHAPRRRKQHRPRLSIISSILKVARHGARKTHIMYRANLSYGQLEDYLAFLTDVGLIRRINDGQEMTTVFSTSPNGVAFLERYETLRNIVDLDDILSLPQRE